MIWTISVFSVGVFLGWFFGPWIDDTFFPEDEPQTNPKHNAKPVDPHQFWGW